MKIDFELQDGIGFRITVPDFPEKNNYFYEPTPILDLFDEATGSFIKNELSIEIATDTLDEILCNFYNALKFLVRKELMLPLQIPVGTTGYFFNRMLNDLDDIELEQYWVWADSKHTTMLMYNFEDAIYCEVIPLYPWLFLDPKKGEKYVTFDTFMQTYKPYAVEVIPQDVAQHWLEHCFALLKQIDSFCVKNGENLKSNYNR